MAVLWLFSCNEWASSIQLLMHVELLILAHSKSMQAIFPRLDPLNTESDWFSLTLEETERDWMKKDLMSSGWSEQSAWIKMVKKWISELPTCPSPPEGKVANIVEARK